MAKPELVAHIEAEMGGWDGTPERAEDVYQPLGDLVKGEPVTTDVLLAFNRNWRQWALRVRRDILVIEALLAHVSKDDLFGDPGDPPPDPDLI